MQKQFFRPWHQYWIFRSNGVTAYAEFDVYSQGKSQKHQYPAGFTSRNMGKSDLWIAATAVVTNSTILTNDNDFDHLNNVFMPVFSLSKDLS